MLQIVIVLKTDNIFWTIVLRENMIFQGKYNYCCYYFFFPNIIEKPIITVLSVLKYYYCARVGVLKDVEFRNKICSSYHVSYLHTCIYVILCIFFFVNYYYFLLILLNKIMLFINIVAWKLLFYFEHYFMI